MRALTALDSPDLTAATASAYLVGFIPGCLASLVVPLAFGTTKQFRDKLYQTFIPLRFQSPHRRRVSREYSFFVDMDSDAGILSRKRRLSMEKRLRIEVTYEFEVRNEVVEVVSSAANPDLDKGLGRAGTISEKRPATVGTQQVEKEQGGGKRASPPKPLNLEQPLPRTPELKLTLEPEPEFSQDLTTYPFSVDSSRWDDTARILPKKPSISFMRGQL